MFFSRDDGVVEEHVRTGSLYGPGRRRMTPTRQFGITIVHDLSVHNQILVFDSNARNES